MLSPHSKITIPKPTSILHKAELQASPGPCVIHIFSVKKDLIKNLFPLVTTVTVLNHKNFIN